MAVRYSKFFRAINMIADVAILNITFYVANAFYYNTPYLNTVKGMVTQFLYINLFWIVASFLTNLYSINRVVNIDYLMKTLVKTFILHILLISGFVTFLKITFVTLKFFLLKYVIFVVMLFVVRAFIFGLLRIARKHGLNFRNVVLIGEGFLIEKLSQFFTKNKEFGYRICGIFNTSTPEKLDKFKAFALEKNIDEIYCSLSSLSAQEVHELIAFSENNLIRFKMLPDFSSFANKQVQISFYGELPVMTIRTEPLESQYNKLVKRTYDVIFSTCIILFVLSWLIPIVAVLIKLSSRGPVFFKQLRSGRDNESFQCYKFRSMQVNEDANEKQATKNDMRITAIGKFLRKTNLDELPQFFNVFMGSMSVVGPRPHMLKHTKDYSKLIDKYMVRHYVKPGITGWAQVHGYRGETREPEMMEKRVEHDVWYIENWSILLDINIIFLTIVNMLKGEENAV